MKNINKISKIITLFYFFWGGGGKVIEPIILDQGPKKLRNLGLSPRLIPKMKTLLLIGQNVKKVN
jgi:hypothetical protein